MPFLLLAVGLNSFEVFRRLCRHSGEVDCHWLGQWPAAEFAVRRLARRAISRTSASTPSRHSCFWGVLPETFIAFGCAEFISVVRLDAQINRLAFNPR